MILQDDADKFKDFCGFDRLERPNHSTPCAVPSSMAALEGSADAVPGR